MTQSRHTNSDAAPPPLFNLEDVCTHITTLATNPPPEHIAFYAAGHDNGSVLLQKLTQQFFLEDAFQCFLLAQEPDASRGASGPYAKRYRYLEAYLWTPTIRSFLHDAGFLEGNYIYVNPHKKKVLLPHVSDPLTSVRLPHLGIDRSEELLLLCSRRGILPRVIEHVQNLEARDEARVHKQWHQIFPRVSGTTRADLFQLLLGCFHRLIEGEQLAQVQTGLAEQLKSLLSDQWSSSLQHFLPHQPYEPSSEALEQIWKNHVGWRVIEECLYQITCTEILRGRSPETTSNWQDQVEFLKFFRYDEHFPITEIEELTGTLWFEDGAISLRSFVHHIDSSDTIALDYLQDSGLLEHIEGRWRVTRRAKRMARWIQRFCDIQTEAPVHSCYASLHKSSGWLWLVDQLRRDLSAIETATTQFLEGPDTVDNVEEACALFTELSSAIRPGSWHCSRQEISYPRGTQQKGVDPLFNLPINTLLRIGEQEARSILCFTFSNVSALDERGYAWTYIGTCHFPDENIIDRKAEVPVLQRMPTCINRLKTVLTVIGLSEYAEHTRADVMETQEELRNTRALATGVHVLRNVVTPLSGRLAIFGERRDLLAADDFKPLMKHARDAAACLERAVALSEDTRRYVSDNPYDAGPVILEEVALKAWKRVGMDLSDITLQQSLIDLHLVGSPDYIQFLFEELFVNARSAMQRTPCPTIRMAGAAIGQVVWITVIDNGPGGAPVGPIQEQLGTERRVTLGRAIIRRIVELHRGEAQVLRSDASGTIILIGIPGMLTYRDASVPVIVSKVDWHAVLINSQETNQQVHELVLNQIRVAGGDSGQVTSTAALF
jgi:signal transduction histidine kinase